MKKIILFILIAFSLSSYSQGIISLTESSRISILTNEPWDGETYSAFGHSAIRVKDSVLGIDETYNYGIFDFYEPNFIYLFFKGQTNYWVEKEETKDYIKRYLDLGINITEQELNLTKEEKQKIWLKLKNNIRPENRKYKYKIFTNNCSTKLIDILDSNVSNKITYYNDNIELSYRSILINLLNDNKQYWMALGINILLGTDANQTISSKEKMFLPIHQKNILDKTELLRNNRKEKLVTNTYFHNSNNKNNTDKFTIKPLYLVILLIIIGSIFLIYEQVRKRKLILAKVYDILLFLVYSFVGIFILFMWFLSEHELMTNNPNILLFNPLLIIIGISDLVNKRYKFVTVLRMFSILSISLYIIIYLFFIQQSNYLLILFSITILTRLVWFKNTKIIS